MRQYYIYLMEEEVARHYFGQESKIFHLFLEQKKASVRNKEIINKQVEYITKPIPVLTLQQLFQQSFKHRTDYRQFKFSHLINQENPRSYSQLELSPKVIHLASEGSFESETMFFEVMRKHSPSFFAMELDAYRYGWLNPIREVKYI